MDRALKEAPQFESEAYGVYPTSASVHLERILPGPIERVWAYLIEPEKRVKWFAEAGVVTTVGETFGLCCGKYSLVNAGEVPERFKDHEKKQMTCVLTRCDPPHALGFTFGAGPEASEVSFELRPHARGVLLIVKHWRLSQDVIVGASAGWHTHLGLLSDLLYGRPVRPFWQRYEKLEREYRKLVPGLS
jgi:uncharacterized protein YndB with AHSA1/START domain